MKVKTFQLIPLLSVAVTTTGFAAESLSTTPAQFKTSFETLELPGGEDMGFLGGQFLYEITDGVSIGPAAYGALTGERGGFITLGGAMDLTYPLTDSMNLNGGLYLGAGGGRGGFQLSGGGLTLRSHVGLDFDLGSAGIIGVGVSNHDYPNGAINSTQPYISYSYPFTTLISDGWNPKGFTSVDTPSIAGSEQDFAVVVRDYSIPAGVTQDNGVRPQYPQMQLVGAEWTNYLDANRFVRLESEGAMGGESRGYMQIFLGGGYRLPVWDGGAVKGALSAGVAGGGAVDTGGGLLVDGQLSVQQQLTDHIYVEMGAGYVMAPQAGFEATTLAAKLGYKFLTPDVQEDTVTFASLSGYEEQALRIRATNQTYPNASFHDPGADVDNLGVQMDYFPTDNLYLTGQGIAAYKGDAGAYMAGLVGAGVHVPLFSSPFYVEAEGLVGAAGGGGLILNGGLVWQANANLGYEITDSISVTAGVGRLEEIDNGLQTNVINLGLAYKFNLFTQ